MNVRNVMNVVHEKHKGLLNKPCCTAYTNPGATMLAT